MKRLIEAKDWVFDLDNTLYPAHSDLFPQIQVRMTEYVADFLKLEKEEARQIQKKYYVEHGTTLNGLMLHHDIDPHHYLHHVHDIDYSRLSDDLRLKTAIESLDGRKIVFTNGSLKHAENAIEAMGLNGVFNEIIDIAATNFIPKPKIEAFETVIKTHNIDTRKAVMVEDLPKNLLTAHQLGFSTILVWSDKIWHDEPKGHAPAGQKDAEQNYIDYSTNNLGEFLSNVVEAAKTKI